MFAPVRSNTLLYWFSDPFPPHTKPTLHQQTLYLCVQRQAKDFGRFLESVRAETQRLYNADRLDANDGLKRRIQEVESLARDQLLGLGIRDAAEPVGCRCPVEVELGYTRYGTLHWNGDYKEDDDEQILSMCPLHHLLFVQEWSMGGCPNRSPSTVANAAKLIAKQSWNVHAIVTQAERPETWPSDYEDEHTNGDVEPKL